MQPSADMRLFRWPMLVALGVTAALGIALRLGLAGQLALPAPFAFLKHAHSHGGVYALLFPLSLACWNVLGIRTPGARVIAVYFGASAVAVGIFAVAGYILPSILASTIVGLVWLHVAYRGKHILAAGRGALRFAPLGLLAASLFVPPIAVTAPRDPQLAVELARSFLATLFFLVMIPTALRRIGAHPLDARVHIPASLLGAAHLGPLPSLLGSAALILLALGILRAIWRQGVARSFQLAWAFFALGAASVAFFESPPHNLTVGGLHYLLLGPLFVSLSDLRAPWRSLVWGAAAAMAMALGPLALLVTNETVHLFAAAAGVAWLGLGGLGFVDRWWRSDPTTRPAPSPDPRPEGPGRDRA